MNTAKFAVNNFPISFILNNIEANLIAIPEIQHLLVWNSTKVRDLLDSIYKDHP